jgi:GntR family transcriptional repressor for pyruvate dehydrogenase complex
MSRTDDVVDGVKRMILNGDLNPGDRLPVEKDLASALGVSRGSLREGVRALSILGVLDTRQGDGTYVTSLDPRVLLAPMGFVVDLHGEGNALSVHRLIEIDIAFHRVIAVRSGNPVPAALIESLASRTIRRRLWRGLTEEGADQRTHGEHEAILAALAAGDPDRARVRMATHLLEVEEFIGRVPEDEIADPPL